MYGMPSDNEPVKRIPYGISDYGLIRRDNHYYVDKTPYLKTIKEAGQYLFFIRPRRFGKTLFLTLMEAYFDIFYRERFQELFKGTWIYENPTDERGKYLVLTLNFSAVDPDPDKMESAFLNHVQNNAVNFIQKYNDYLSANPRKDYFAQKTEESQSASEILSSLLSLCKGAQQRLYVMIDEYDNFANTLLSTAGRKVYQKLTHGPGFFRSFFNVLKSGTGTMDAPVTRSFITGVSPITMDDVTSGFNIGKNVSLDHDFNRMLGFTRDDVIEMIDYYRSKGLIKHPTDYLLAVITQWYGNYLFSEDDNVRLFNSDMILYFIDNYLTRKKLPEDLIDRNVRIDYGKLRHLIIVDRDQTGKARKPVPNGNFDKLNKIIEAGGTSSKIEKGFPLEKLVDEKNFKSLLFYLGLLTIKGPEKNKLRLEIPNETVQRLYYDYIEEAYNETGIFSLDLSKYSDLMTDMAYDGKWELLFEYLTGRMSKNISLRDLITGEKSIQAFLNVYLGLSDLYIIHSEKELNKGYADIVLEPFLARYEGIKYSYLLEIKYIPKTKGKSQKELEKNIRQLRVEAEDQLKRYGGDERLKKTIGQTTVVKLVLIFCGSELEYIGEAK
ncbi:MAG: AAA family ATPase [Candidatus Aminicenantes bacterium]|jgi:hypothetical protein